jgi:hypothetical protein
MATTTHHGNKNNTHAENHNPRRQPQPMALDPATSERAKHKATPTIIDPPPQKQPHPRQKP